MAFRLFLAWLFFAALAGQAASNDAQKCQGIENIWEYNLCLSKLSEPKARLRRSPGPPPEAETAVRSRKTSTVKAVVPARAKAKGIHKAGYFLRDGRRWFRYPGGLEVPAP